MNESATKVMRARRDFERLVPRPWNRQTFLANLGEHRGRPVSLIAVQSAQRGTPCGLWLAYADHDEIVYDRDTSDYHVDHTILHEVGHMVLDHRCEDRESGLVTIQRLLPDIDTARIEKVLGRSHFDDQQESEAEMFADLLMAGSYSPYRRSAPMTSLWGSRA